MTFYEVWDLESRNLLDDAETRDEALALVQSLINTGDVFYQRHLGLNRIDDDGGRTLVARGEDLARLAIEAAAA